MSLILANNTILAQQIRRRNDDRGQWYFDTLEAWNGLRVTDVLWSRSRVFGSWQGPQDNISGAYETWTWSHRYGGVTESWQIFGQFLDQNSSPLANAAASLYDQPTQTLVDQDTTDGGGNYGVGNPYGSARGQVLFYRAGTPNVAGTSDIGLP